MGHYPAKLGRYKDQLITVGGGNAETEILTKRDDTFKWEFGGGRNASTGDIRSNFILSPKAVINEYSMVNIPQNIASEEYLLLIGHSFLNSSNISLFQNEYKLYNSSL